MAQSQLSFSGEGLDLDVDQIRNWMIAHMGNSVTGLEAIYLTAPRNGTSGLEWSHAYLLWKREDEPRDMATPFSPETTDKRVPMEQIPDKVALRKKKRKDAEV